MAGFLDNPDKLFAWVIKIQANLVIGACDGLGAGELELLDEILVRHLGEPATFIGIKVDILYPESGVHEGKGALRLSICVDPESAELLEENVDLHFVVLESNKGKGETGVTAEPELEGNEEGILRFDGTVVKAESAVHTHHVVVGRTH